MVVLGVARRELGVGAVASYCGYAQVGDRPNPKLAANG